MSGPIEQVDGFPASSDARSFVKRPVLGVGKSHRPAIATSLLEIDVNDGRAKKAAKRAADDVAEEHQHRWIVDVSPSHGRKRRGVVEHPNIVGVDYRIAHQPCLVWWVGDRHGVRCLRVVENVGVEAFAVGWRFRQFASSHTPLQVGAVGGDEKFRMRQRTPQGHQIADQPAWIGLIGRRYRTVAEPMAQRALREGIRRQPRLSRVPSLMVRAASRSAQK
jgi:hypothetical protein